MTNRSYIRSLELHDMMAHAERCTCPSCRSRDFQSLEDFGSLALADGDFSNSFKRIPALMEEDFLKRLHGSSWKPNTLDAPIWREYYSRFRQFSEAGYGKALDAPKDWGEFQLMEQLKRSASTFSGGKLATVQAELKTLRKLPLKDFLEEGKKVLKRHHKDYLRAELDTALASANSAAKWESIQRRAFLYPNLRYETAGDERVRESHKELNGKIYPVNSAFWDTFMPPNGWRCRCIVVQSDEQPTGTALIDFEPPKGFRNNPGKTGKLFESDHPYFNWKPSDLAEIETASEALRAGWEARDVARLAQRFVGTSHSLPGISAPVPFTADFISTTLAEPTTERAIRNDLLTYFGVLATQVKLIGTEGKTYLYKVSVAGFQFVLEVVYGLFKSIR